MRYEFLILTTLLLVLGLILLATPADGRIYNLTMGLNNAIITISG